MKLVKICETLFCHTIILTNRFYIVNKSAQTTNLLYTLCVESFYVIPCFLVQVCDLFRSKGGSVIFEGLVIPFLHLVHLFKTVKLLNLEFIVNFNFLALF